MKSSLDDYMARAAEWDELAELKKTARRIGWNKSSWNRQRLRGNSDYDIVNSLANPELSKAILASWRALKTLQHEHGDNDEAEVAARLLAACQPLLEAFDGQHEGFTKLTRVPSLEEESPGVHMNASHFQAHSREFTSQRCASEVRKRVLQVCERIRVENEPLTPLHSLELSLQTHTQGYDIISTPTPTILDFGFFIRLPDPDLATGVRSLVPRHQCRLGYRAERHFLSTLALPTAGTIPQPDGVLCFGSIHEDGTVLVRTLFSATERDVVQEDMRLTPRIPEPHMLLENLRQCALLGKVPHRMQPSGMPSDMRSSRTGVKAKACEVLLRSMAMWLGAEGGLVPLAAVEVG